MSVLIRGMEMPKSCIDCRFHKSIYCTLTDICTNTAQRCPLVPVPPHGRLIDADAILGKIRAIISAHPDEADLYEQDAVIVRDWLRSEPTIIESDHLRDNTKMVEREGKNVSN